MCPEHVQKNTRLENATVIEIQDLEAIVTKATNRNIYSDSDKEFTDVNTREIERKNTPPKDEQQYIQYKVQEVEIRQAKETSHPQSTPHSHQHQKIATFQAVSNRIANINTQTHRTYNKVKLDTEIRHIWSHIVPTLKIE